LNEDCLRVINRAIFDRVTVTANFNHMVLIGDVPENCARNGEKRIMARVYDNERKPFRILATAIIVYFNPMICWETDALERVCGKKHRTIYDFCKDHPSYSPHNLHISHICHNGQCLNPKHLLIEPALKNLSRNSCRGECECGNVPPCFTESTS